MKKVNLARLLDRLTSRFKLTDVSLAFFRLPEIIMPITNVDELLKSSKCESIDADVSAGTSNFVVVPEGKRYRVLNLYVEASTDPIGVYIYDASDGVWAFVVAPVNTAKVVNNANWLLEESDALVLQQGAVGDSAIRCDTILEVEDAY